MYDEPDSRVGENLGPTAQEMLEVWKQALAQMPRPTPLFDLDSFAVMGTTAHLPKIESASPSLFGMPVIVSEHVPDGDVYVVPKFSYRRPLYMDTWVADSVAAGHGFAISRGYVLSTAETVGDEPHIPTISQTPSWVIFGIMMLVMVVLYLLLML